MKSIYLKKYGNSANAFELRETPRPACGPQDVLIKVECFGLNYAEVMARNGLYDSAPPLPCVLGYEVAGVICEVGENVAKHHLGKRVVAFTRFGGYAQYAVTNQHAFTEIDDMNAGEACCIAVQYATAYYMAYEATNLNPGDRVLIHAGAGGVGSALIQLCALKGCTVFATAGSDDKLEYMQKLGANHVFNYRKNDYEHQLKTATGAHKLDVTFNPIGGSTFKKDFRLIGSGGRIILFGASERSGKKFGILSSLNFLRKMGLIFPVFLISKSKSLIGVNMLKIGDDKPEMLARCLKNVAALVAAQKLKPHVGARFAASQLADAHALLESRRSIGKIVVYWEQN